jgi:cytochrome P450
MFTKREVARYEGLIRDVARRLVERALDLGELDVAMELSRELPIRALCIMLGIPMEDVPRLVRWADAMVGNTDPEYADVLVDRDDTEAYRFMPFRSPAGLEVFEYAQELRRDRLATPREDVMTALANATIGGEPMSDREYNHYFSLLVVAGNETTRHTISHGVIALAESPQQLELLRADPMGVSATAAEEMIRWATPAMHFRRTAARDTELRGQAIREGDKVVTWYISANRDELVFEDPYRFDVTRSPNPQVAFGPHGASLHFCLGADLARLETRVMFEELASRVRSIRLAGPYERLRSNFHNGIKHLPAELLPA